jgi:hypothetical protein
MDGQLKEIRTSPRLSVQNVTLEHLIIARGAAMGAAPLPPIEK